MGLQDLRPQGSVFLTLYLPLDISFLLPSSSPQRKRAPESHLWRERRRLIALWSSTEVLYSFKALDFVTNVTFLSLANPIAHFIFRKLA